MNNFFAKWTFYTLEFIRREPVYRFIRQRENIQRKDSSEIKVIQQNKLSMLLEYITENNEYYKKKYNGYDVYKDFKHLPVLTKDELRKNYKSIVTDRRIKLDLAKTSGSTGKPLKFYRDRFLFANSLASKYAGHRWHGLDIGSKEARLWGVPTNYKDRIKIKLRDLVLNRFREKDFDMSDDVLYDFFKKIYKKKPDYIYGYTSMVYEFALFLKEKGIDASNFKLKAIICTSESILEHQRYMIEQVFQTNVVSEYGSAETGIISFECSHGMHHIMEDSVFIEVVDDRYKPVKTGERGRILVTVLNSFYSPIIRYDLGDIVACSDRKCSCGINFSLLKEITGRVSSIVITPSRKVFHSLIFYYIMKGLTGKGWVIKQFRAYQKEIDLIHLKLVTNNKESEIALCKFLERKLKETFGDGMRFEFEFVEKIEREKSGKLRDYISEIDTLSILKDGSRLEQDT